MQVPIKWLYEFVPCNKTVKELAELLIQKGIEVTNIKRIGEILDGFIVAEIREIKNNKIRLFDGKCFYEVFAVSYHLKHNDKIGFNPVTSKLINPELLDISEDTLPYALRNDYQTGSPVLNYLDDYVLDLEILPNRGDLMSIIGVARELASYEEISMPFKLPTQPTYPESNKYNIANELKLDVLNQEGCPDYIARLICDVSVEPSPFHLQWRLIAVGLRPINNIVDATNYIMFKYGTPLHAFDYERIIGQNIVVRSAKKGEKIKTIDNIIRPLNEQVLLIADQKNPISIAGVMGGSDTEISMTTKKVILECARFDSKIIRKSNKTINLSTPASQRFEMGIDPDILETASCEASNFIAELSRGEVAKDKLAIRSKKESDSVSINLAMSKVNQLLGVSLEKKRIKNILEKLNCILTEQNDLFTVKIPSYRLDLKRDVDLIEEIGRSYGYSNLPSDFMLRGGVPGETAQLSKDIAKIRNFFVGAGFIENYTISFCDEKTAQVFTDNMIIKIPCPLNERYAVLRPSILATLLDCVKINYTRSNKDLRLFEIGKIFERRNTDLNENIESIFLTAVISGQTSPNYWKHTTASDYDFFDIKGITESFIDNFKISDLSFEETDIKFLFKHSSQLIKYADKEIGYIGEVKKPILDRFDIPVSVYALEINLQELLKLAPTYRYFQPLPRFPSSIRDFAFIVDKKISTSKMIQTIRKITGALLESVEVFDYFRGKPLPAGKRNLGIRITLRSEERTLNQTEVNKIFERVVVYLKEKMQVELRGETNA